MVDRVIRGFESGLVDEWINESKRGWVDGWMDG